MTLKEYIIFLVLIGICAIFSMVASRKVNSSFAEFSAVPTLSNMTGYDAAARLLRRNGVTDISIGRVRGSLTDHYHPSKKIVNLSDSVYGNASVAAVAVAAHEVGHVMQKKKGYLPYKIRNVLVPIANIGSRLAMPLVILGVILDLFVVGTANSDIGFYAAMVGVALYGASTLFMLVTLPVEFNASRRAKKMLLEEGIITERELDGASRVLGAAALTYVASLATSLVYFLRFLVWVLAIFGRRRD
jgi:Zn-dependent membrane protease YugP